MDFPNTSVPPEENIFKNKKKAFVGIIIFLLFILGIFFYIKMEKEVLSDEEKKELLGSIKSERVYTEEEIKNATIELHNRAGEPPSEEDMKKAMEALIRQ